MSDNIPFEIQEEIMKRLPVKSLIQFRSVSKPWKSLIDSSDFIANYHHTQTQHRLLLSYADPDPQHNFKQICVSIVDDDSFPQHKFMHTLPVSVQQLHKPTLLYKTPYVLCGSQGLFCFYNFRVMSGNPPTSIAVIWNPAIRKSIDVVVPNVLDSKSYKTMVLGFGVCPHTNDPKLVKATYDSYGTRKDSPWEVEVFTLSSGVWRSPKSSNRPRSLTGLAADDNVVVDGFIYWPAYETKGDYKLIYPIMSFDLTKEEFAKEYLPDNILIDGSVARLSLSKLRDSLVVLQSSYELGVLLNCGVWMMEKGDPKSFTKIFTIDPLDASLRMVLGFRKSGESLLLRREEHNAVSVYEHDSEQTNYIGIHGDRFSFYASSYMETLLLLDH